jgi:uncharacterized membrane protein
MTRRGWLWIALVPAACIAYQCLIHALVVDASTTSTRLALSVLNAVPHAAINLLLLGVFGRTLVRGREPLVTGIARRVHGSLRPHIESYTRSVTLAWCVFFAAQVVVSAILFATAPLDTWSLFVNVLSFPLIVLMFVGEYLYRIARFPDHPHVSILKGIEMYAAQGRAARPTEARSQN